jgi:hypothetical protein
MSRLTDAASATDAPTDVELTYRDAINAALHDAMTDDPTVLLMG